MKNQKYLYVYIPECAARSDKASQFMSMCRELPNRLNYECSDFRKNQFRFE